MNSIFKMSVIVAYVVVWSTVAQGEEAAKPAELRALKAAVGVWDAEIEVWPAGRDKPSMTFKGVETNRAFGEYWLDSDFDSEFGGQPVTVHSIVGYDLDRKQLVGTVIDQGPYAASMVGDYDAKTNIVKWEIKAKAPDGTPMVQHVTITQKTADVRVLVMSVPGDTPSEFIKSMQITFTRRK